MKTLKDTREVWQRGPVANIPALLQPVAHALLQAREELFEILKDFPEKLLWERPEGIASPGFHLQHLTGVLDRLFTYAGGRQLNAEQLHWLNSEGNREAFNEEVESLVKLFDEKVDECLEKLSDTDVATLTETRVVGRKKIPTTVIGLYIHAAEHTMRHMGQLMVTAKIIRGTEPRQPFM